jgi:enoyl-CoA hydratase/carnithine racemase
MGRPLKYYMWGYQPHLWISVKLLAEKLFEELGCQVAPSVFLVGMRTREQEGSLPICVEPEECVFQPDKFHDLSRRVDVHLKSPKATEWFHNSEAVAKQFEDSAYRSAVSAAVMEIVESVSGEEDWVTFCSHARPVKNYMVVAVLQLCRPRVEAWPALTRDTVDRMRAMRSLIESTARQFVRHCAKVLDVSEPGANFSGGADVGELLRAAGKELGYTPAYAGRNDHGLHTFYDTCNVISSLRYEGGAGTGGLVVCRTDHPGLRPVLTLADPVPLTEYHAARKLLELASEDTFLFTDSYQIFGLGTLADDYEPHLEDLFVVRFTRHHVWELWHAQSPLMRVAHNEPRLPRRKIDLNSFLDTVGRVLPAMDQANARYLAQMSGIATELGRGCLLVIAEDAAAEALRLDRQAIRVRPVRMIEDVVRRAAAIDGALLIDVTLTCHAVGVILDGTASAKATRSRGARYNSAVRYVYGRKRTLAVVVSEDGMVDVLPRLRPRIKRRELDEWLNRLREIANQPKIERKVVNETGDWFRDHQFYLNVKECEEVNRLLEQATARYDDDGTRVVFGPFAHNDDLDDSYFIHD